MPDPHDALLAQIQRRMVCTGEWDRVSEVFSQKLNESGWVDNLHNNSKEKFRTAAATSSRDITVKKLIEELGSQPESSVPPKLKEELVHMIRQFVDSQLEK